MSQRLQRELDTAVAIAREAGRVLLEIYATDFGVDYKGQGKSDPVTEADRRANELIVQRLRAAFPDDGIVAEESDDNALALSKSRIWYVDPLDGTKEFVSKNGEFSVMIGLSIDGSSQLGVVLQPSEDKLYRGVVGAGAHLEHAGKTRELHVSTQAATRELRLIVSRSHRPKSTEELMQRLGISKEVISGSVGLKIGHIAEQTADLYVHVSDKASAWDACAPEAVLRAAGGRFSDLAGKPFVYGKADLRTSGGILACNAAAFEAVLPVVSEIGTREGFPR
ncbi:MAG TPA: 3'(2'),5'-bisphosphate nucleotidase CysQ [Polyangiales bacterium]|jgi:3'(2'), 5'-bisphosphate nucleotidase|nr:3'(2'),5'-bisphosphate nucleotidase CysQ [Polyangiales bacterium]